MKHGSSSYWIKQDDRITKNILQGVGSLTWCLFHNNKWLLCIYISSRLFKKRRLHIQLLFHVCLPAVQRFHDEVQQLAQCYSNGFMRGGVEGWHLLHNALCMLPVSDLQQRLEQTQFLVIGWLERKMKGQRGEEGSYSFTYGPVYGGADDLFTQFLSIWFTLYKERSGGCEK